MPLDPNVIAELRRRIRESASARQASAVAAVESLLGTVDRYEQLGDPEAEALLRELPLLIAALGDLDPKAAGAVASYISCQCRACPFHHDACFINVIYLVYKSLEEGRLVGPNAIRPNLRFVA